MLLPGWEMMSRGVLGAGRCQHVSVVCFAVRFSEQGTAHKIPLTCGVVFYLFYWQAKYVWEPFVKYLSAGGWGELFRWCQGGTAPLNIPPIPKTAHVCLLSSFASSLFWNEFVFPRKRILMKLFAWASTWFAWERVELLAFLFYWGHIWRFIICILLHSTALFSNMHSIW